MAQTRGLCTFPVDDAEISMLFTRKKKTEHTKIAAPQAPPGRTMKELQHRRRSGLFCSVLLCYVLFCSVMLCYVQNIGKSRRHRRRPAPEAHPAARARDVLFPTQTAPGDVGKCAKPRVNIEIGAAGAGKMRNTI
eukprot:gene12979-biopygen3474